MRPIFGHFLRNFRFILSLGLCALALPLVWLGCDLPATGSDSGLTQLSVQVVAGSDSLPLAGAEVRVISVTNDSIQKATDANGRVKFDALEGRKFIVLIQKPGYRDILMRDSLAVWDSASGLAYRSLVFVMQRQRLATDTAFVLELRDDAGQRILGASLRRGEDDSLGPVFQDTAKLGSISVTWSDAASEKQWFASRSGYMGKKLTLMPPKNDSDEPIHRYAAVLPKLLYRLSGTIQQQSPMGPRPLLGGAVEWIVDDSAFVPRRFRVNLSDSLSAQGTFVFDSLPALPGKLSVFRNRATAEPAATQSLTAASIVMDAKLPPWVLESQSENQGQAWVMEWPNDSLNSTDTLTFRFNEKIAAIEGLKVAIPNVTDEIWVTQETYDSGRALRVFPREGPWFAGRTYAFQFRALGVSGAWLTRFNDTATWLKGGFTVRNPKSNDTSLAFPDSAAWMYFNSGENPRFDSADAQTSSLCDSSSRFAKLRWRFKVWELPKVDSLVMYVRDENGLTGGWSRLEAFPAGIESTTVALDFSRMGLTIGNDNPIRVRLAAKQGKTMVAGKEWDLPPLKQSMGPSLWVRYAVGDSLRLGENARDTVQVRFLTAADTQSVAYDFGTTRPTPTLLLNGKTETTVLAWEWVNGKTGRLIYAFSGFPGLRTRLQVDLHGAATSSGPIWIRNRQEAVLLP
jgi:hypothetical protein